MKHHSRTVVLIMMVFLSLFGMFGCGSKSKIEQAEKKILKALHEKYGKEFELKTIGGGWGTMNNNTWKAVVKPKDDPYIKVFVEITKDLKHVYDDYLNEMVARAAEKPIQEMANSIWKDSRVIITNDTGMTYPEHADTNMSYDQFLNLYPMNRQLVMVYVNADDYIDDHGNIDEKGEIEKYKYFAQMLSDNKYFRSTISIRYVTPYGLKNFEEAKNSDMTISDYFEGIEESSGKSIIITANGLKTDNDGKIITKEEEYFNRFNIWKEKRSKRAIEKRGEYE